MFTSWILKYRGKKIADSVEYVSDALELEDICDQTSGNQLFESRCA